MHSHGKGSPLKSCVSQTTQVSCSLSLNISIIVVLRGNIRIDNDKRFHLNWALIRWAVVAAVVFTAIVILLSNGGGLNRLDFMEGDHGWDFS